MNQNTADNIFLGVILSCAACCLLGIALAIKPAQATAQQGSPSNPSVWECIEGASCNNGYRTTFVRKVPGGRMWMVTNGYSDGGTALVFQPDELTAEKTK